MNLVLCDDNLDVLEECQSLLSTYACETGQKIKFIPYQNSLSLYDELEDHQMADLYLLDIDMPEVNGLQLAQKIHTIDQNIPIIFLTAYLEYAPSAIRVQAFRYVSKMRLQEELREAFESALQYRERLFRYACLTIKTNGTCFRIPYDQIQYAEKKGKYIQLHTIYRTYAYRGDMKQLLRNLNDDRFSRVDRSYIVNLDFVEGYTNDTVQLSQSNSLPISRRMLPTFKKNFSKRWMYSIAELCTKGGHRHAPSD